jgi:hypothetical protein
MFTDSDVLYFEGASELARSFGDRPRYLLDCDVSLDRRMLEPGEEQTPVNSGVLLLTRPLDWSAAIERFKRVRAEPERFSEQTAVHVAMRTSGGEMLDPSRWLVTVRDQFQWRDVSDPRDHILRHYVGTVRHKMWNMAHRLRLDR